MTEAWANQDSWEHGQMQSEAFALLDEKGFTDGGEATAYLIEHGFDEADANNFVTEWFRAQAYGPDNPEL